MDDVHQKLNSRVDEIIVGSNSRRFAHFTKQQADENKISSLPEWVVRIENRLNAQEVPRSIELVNDDYYRKGHYHGFQLNLINKTYYYLNLPDSVMPLHEQAAAIFARSIYASAKKEISACRFQAVVEEIRDEVFRNILGLCDKDRDCYMSGMSDGYAHQTRDSDNTLILNFLYVLWPSVERMKSVTQLWKTLTKEFGPQLIGDKNRIENICRRYGIHLGKPGRPQKHRQASEA